MQRRKVRVDMKLRVEYIYNIERIPLVLVELYTFYETGVEAHAVKTWENIFYFPPKNRQNKNMFFQIHQYSQIKILLLFPIKKISKSRGPT